MQETQETTIQEFESAEDDRYEKYSDYEVTSGENLQKVPSHWEDKPLQFWAERKNEKGNEEEMEFITLEHINSVTGDLVDDFEWEKKKSKDYYLFESGDVLFGKLRPYLRKYYQVNREGCCGTDLIVLRPRPDVISRYLYYFLHSEDLIQFSDANSHGVKMPRISWTKLSSAHFRLPPREEQKAIVKFLDRECKPIDDLILQKSNLIGLLEEKREALIKRLVSDGIDSKNNRKESGVEWLGKIPENWEVRKLRYLANIDTGGKDTKDAVDDGEYPFFVRSQTEERIDSYSFDGEAILTAGDGVGVGEVFHYIDGKFDFHQRVYKISDLSEDVDGEYLYYFLRANLKMEIFKNNAKSTVDSLRMPMFKSFPVAFGELKEQQEIVAYIDEENKRINRLINKINEGIDKLKEYRVSLITNAVTGQIDVRGEV